MNDHLDSVEEPTADELARIDALLSRPDVWDEPPAGLEDAVVAAVVSEAASTPWASTVASAGSDSTVSLDERRAARKSGFDRSAIPWWLASAAAIAVLVAGIAFATRSGTPEGTEIALAGTEAAPAASAEVVLAATPAGLKILLDADGLRGAPEGFYYEAWVSDGTIRVSAGTFHLRGGDGPIELWAGVTDPSFRMLSVTLEPIDGDPGTSGNVQLVGEFDLTD